MFFDEKKSNSFFRKIENDAVVDEIRLLGIKLYYSEKKITKYPLRFCNIDSKLKYSKLQDAIDDPTQGTGVYHSEMGYKCVCENCGCEFWSDWGEDKCLECSIFDEEDSNE